MRVLSMLLALCFYSQVSVGQAPIDICETKVPENWVAKGGKLSITNEHFKAGQQSVKWEWKSPKQQLQITSDAFGKVQADPRSTFVVWVYNQQPIADKLVFEFGTDNKVNASFDFHLNFTGWRTAWVMYHRDMKGEVVQGMNTLRVKAPSSVRKGTLYFDQVIYHATINPRSPMRDEQVPMVNLASDKAANAHWTALYSYSRIPHYLPLPAQVSAKAKQDLQEISARYEQMLLAGAKAKKKDVQELQKAFSYWNIRRNGKQITGRPVYSVNDIELLSQTAGPAAKEWNLQFGVKRYTDLMLKIAVAYRTSQEPEDKKQLESMFLDLLDHLEDQGWAADSGLGALHHLGYNFRSYYSACLLMKQSLVNTNRLDRTWKSMNWFSGLGRTQQKPKELPLANIDVFNTLLGSMLATVLIMEDTPEKVRQLQEFSNWLSEGMKPDYALGGTIKPDGAVFHHGTLYPAYATGGFQGLAPILYVLSKTSFQASEIAHASLKKAMLMMHYYTNPFRWPISVSGRHPTGNWSIPEEPYAYMALAGTPDGQREIDPEMAAAYLKISDKKDKWQEKFKGLGIKPTVYPAGHWTLNYGLFSIHRRQDWLLSVRGHNRYITSHEAYPGANMYGRYLAYGHLEVLFPETDSSSGSNFADKGWDWNNIPGSTTLHLPLDKLRADIKNVDDFSGIEEMLITDEVFAGGTNLNKQGLFSMKLRGHDKYEMGSFRANKSWFMFDSLVVCLGSNIHNTIEKYPTQTTLFQNHLRQNSSATTVNGQVISTFPYSKEWEKAEKLSVLDHRNIGYYLPSAKGAVLTRTTQHSRNQKDTQNTSGSFEKLVIDHDNAPKTGGYEYAMLINTDPGRMRKFVSTMSSAKPVYEITQQDSTAHSVWYAPLQMAAAAFFKAASGLNDPFLVSNSRACLVMYQNEKDAVSMAVTDPDMAFYTGPDDSPLTADGKRKEVSIYSRDWYRSPSQPSAVELVVKGRWNAASAKPNVTATATPDGNTRLSIPCENGIATEVRLTKSTN